MLYSVDSGGGCGVLKKKRVPEHAAVLPALSSQGMMDLRQCLVRVAASNDDNNNNRVSHRGKKW